MDSKDELKMDSLINFKSQNKTGEKARDSNFYCLQLIACKIKRSWTT